MNTRHKIARLSAQLLARTLPVKLLSSPRHFAIWESKGYHIPPVFYESPVPPSSDLTPALWQKPSKMPGIDMRDSEQIRLLETFRARFKTAFLPGSFWIRRIN